MTVSQYLNEIDQLLGIALCNVLCCAVQRDNSSPFDDDESLPYTLDSTYWDPSSNAGHSSGVAYEPPENMFGPSDSAG